MPLPISALRLLTPPRAQASCIFVVILFTVQSSYRVRPGFRFRQIMPPLGHDVKPACDALSPKFRSRKASEVIGKLNVLTPPQLIQFKLAARRHYEFGDVVFLIRVHQLDESYLSNLHPAVHRDSSECLEEKRREDDYESRET